MRAGRPLAPCFLKMQEWGGCVFVPSPRRWAANRVRHSIRRRERVYIPPGPCGAQGRSSTSLTLTFSGLPWRFPKHPQHKHTGTLSRPETEQAETKPEYREGTREADTGAGAASGAAVLSNERLPALPLPPGPGPIAGERADEPWTAGRPSRHPPAVLCVLPRTGAILSYPVLQTMRPRRSKRRRTTEGKKRKKRRERTLQVV